MSSGEPGEGVFPFLLREAEEKGTKGMAVQVLYQRSAFCVRRAAMGFLFHLARRERSVSSGEPGEGVVPFLLREAEEEGDQGDGGSGPISALSVLRAAMGFLFHLAQRKLSHGH